MNSTEQKIQELYDQHALAYHQLRKDPNKMKTTHYFNDYHLLQQLKPLVKGKFVHEIGCGSGYFTHKVLQLQPRSLSAQDPARSFIAIAEQEYDHIDFSVGDATSIDYPTEELDVLYASLSVPHYQEKPRKVFLEAHRVLKPGGHFLFTTSHPVFDSFDLRNPLVTKKGEAYLKKKAYFPEDKKDTWKLTNKKGGFVWENMPYFRHSFGDISKLLYSSGFKHQMFEPTPAPQLQHKDPTYYEEVKEMLPYVLYHARKLS